MAAEPPAPSVTEAIEAVADVYEDLLADPVSESRSPADVPEDSDGMVDFDGTDFAIGLPGDQDADATRRGDTVVFAGTDTASSTVVTPTAEGVQIMTVLDSQAADTSPTYALDLPAGGTAHPLPDGSIVLTDANDTPAVVIAAPWAQDATGRDLPTHYTIAGDQLTQHIDTQGAVFPVVADPRVVLDCGIISCSAYFSRAFTKRIYERTLEEYGYFGPGALAWAGAKLCARVSTRAAATVGDARIVALVGGGAGLVSPSTDGFWQTSSPKLPARGSASGSSSGSSDLSTRHSMLMTLDSARESRGDHVETNSNPASMGKHRLPVLLDPGRRVLDDRAARMGKPGFCVRGPRDRSHGIDGSRQVVRRAPIRPWGNGIGVVEGSAVCRSRAGLFATWVPDADTAQPSSGERQSEHVVFVGLDVGKSEHNGAGEAAQPQLSTVVRGWRL